MDNFNLSYPSELLKNSTSSRGYIKTKLLLGKKINSEIYDLYTSSFRLIQPIPVTLRYKNRSYIIIQETLNLGEEATTLQDAEKRLVNEILQLYKKLTSDSIKLGPYPEKLLSYLRKYIS